MECYHVVKLGQEGITTINDFGPIPQGVLVCIRIVVEDGIDSTQPRRIHWGPKLAPGRPMVAVSKGAPRIAIRVTGEEV
jgi:hypothetical protein